MILEKSSNIKRKNWKKHAIQMGSGEENKGEGEMVVVVVVGG